MRRWKLYLPILLGAICIGGWAWTQVIVQQTFSGNEVWNCGQGPGGPTTGFCGINGARNSTGYLVANGGVMVSTLSQATDNVLMIAPPLSGSLFTLQQNPIDGQLVNFCNETGSPFAGQSASFIPNSGQIFVSGGTFGTLEGLASYSCIEVTFQLSSGSTTNGTWYRLR